MTSGDHLQLDDDLLLSCFIDFMPSRPASHVLDEREPAPGSVASLAGQVEPVSHLRVPEVVVTTSTCSHILELCKKGFHLP